jgi:hypothetical protein
MRERRQALRIATLGRVRLQPIADGEADAARLRVAVRSAPDLLGPAVLDDAGSMGEERTRLELLQRMACMLERIDARLEALARAQRSAQPAPDFSDLLPLSLSATGVSGPFELAEPPGSLVELTLDLVDPGLPLIPALASIVRTGEDVPEKTVALRFEEITTDDRERLFRYAIRIQRQSLRRQSRREDDT